MTELWHIQVNSAALMNCFIIYKNDIQKHHCIHKSNNKLVQYLKIDLKYVFTDTITTPQKKNMFFFCFRLLRDFFPGSNSLLRLLFFFLKRNYGQTVKASCCVSLSGIKSSTRHQSSRQDPLGFCWNIVCKQMLLHQMDYPGRKEVKPRRTQHCINGGLRCV